jgi:hypothetical protein
LGFRELAKVGVERLVRGGLVDDNGAVLQGNLQQHGA